MKRSRIELYLYGLLAGSLLAGCTAGPVEEIVPEESRPVALSFGKPDLGVPELLTRAGDNETPVPTPLPPGTTVRIGAYFTGDVGGESPEASFPTTVWWGKTAPCRPARWMPMESGWKERPKG